MLPKGKKEEEELNFAIRYRTIGTLGKRKENQNNRPLQSPQLINRGGS
jgi:hypothetical protein